MRFMPLGRTLGNLGLALIVALAGTWLTPRTAWAHGGRFIPPPIGPPPPPGIRPPGIIPVTPPGFPTTPTRPGPLTPSTKPGNLPGPSTTPFDGGRTRRIAPTSDPSARWQTWWNLNRLAYLPDRDVVQGRSVTTPNERDDPRFWALRRGAMGEKHVVPFLLRITDPKSKMRDDVVSSALIALGKTARDPAVIELLLDRLGDRKAAPIVRESAALAAGLLRRSDPEFQFDAHLLDDLRARLLASIDDATLPVRAQAFAVLSVGMLGDQPFGSPYAKDGRLVTRELWTRLAVRHAQNDVPVALLTALGLQPSAGVPDGVREGLSRLVVGKSVHGRRWDGFERGHALTAALRLGGPGSHAQLLRVLNRAREERDVRRAAVQSLGFLAERMDAEERLEAAVALGATLKRARDPLSRGLVHIAYGHLLGADLRDGHLSVLTKARVDRLLLSESRSGPATSRGFSVLALALARRGLKPEERQIVAFLAESEDVLNRTLARDGGNPDLRSACAVAAGLGGATNARGVLLSILADRGANAELRGHAAVSLGWLGSEDAEIERALHLALAEKRDVELRSQAALGVALLGGRRASTQLLRQLRTGKTELLLAQVTIALGRLGELSAVHPLLEHAGDGNRSELAQSLGVVALGLLVDPEPRPSLLRLTWSSFYTARTASMDEAFTIL